jgi:hypothetical protein
MKRNEKKNFFMKTEKKIEMNNIIEFPSLSPSVVISQINKSENKEKMNYMSVSLKEEEEKNSEIYLRDWLYISMDKNDGKIKKIINGKNYKKSTIMIEEEDDIESLSKTEFNDKANKVISEMMKNWENYKTWYINLYGEDCYEKMYEMVCKEDDIVYDDEYGEDDNLNQDNTYTDEDEDYY